MLAILPIPPRGLLHLLWLFASVSWVASGQSLPYLFEKDPAGRPNRIFWKTEPGVRYDLWTSPSLDVWNHVPGYPLEAGGLAMGHAFNPGPAGFFQIVPIDEQPPVVKSQFPAVDGFAVDRFAVLSIELEDASEIDPTTVQLTVGATGPLEVGAAGLAISGNTITYDPGGSVLGNWGETLTATLVVADRLGNELSHTWRFRLESEAMVAPNSFVFGSPTAQRAGQEVSGPAAPLADRFPLPVGPPVAPSWRIDSVLADRILISYDTDVVPGFTSGQLVCNLAPANESHIFYRRVLSTSDAPQLRRLTVMTEEVRLSDLALRGAVALTEDSVAFELGADGGLVQAFALDGNFTFPPMGEDFSGSGFALRNDGYQATVHGVTESQGSTPTFLEVSMSQFAWWFTPRLRTGLEISSGELTGFEAIASGDVSISTAFTGQATRVGATAQRTLHDLPAAREPRRLVYLGSIGSVPVFGILRLDFRIKGEAQAQAAGDFQGVYQHEIRAAIGASYQAGGRVGWVHDFQSSAPNLDGEVDSNGGLSWEISLEPQLEFQVYGIAGIEMAVAPAVGAAEPLAGLQAGVDLRLKLGGPAFESLEPNEGATGLAIWSGQVGDELGFATHPASQAVKWGGDVSFSCVVKSEGVPQFQWFQNGIPIPGQTGRGLGLNGIKAGHAGSYTVRATLGALTIESNPALLTVQGPAPDEFVLIPAGSFQMGDPTDFGDAWGLTVHPVNVSAFSMAKFEVSKALWDEVRAWALTRGYPDLPPGGGKAANHPVHSISWHAMVKWCNARSEKDGLTPCYRLSGAIHRTGSSNQVVCNWNADGYRLPSEAEWEKAARGGLSGRIFPWGNTISHSQANYYSWPSDYGSDVSPTLGPHPDFYDEGTMPWSSPVGSFAPNGYGLSDMIGNVGEWCWDWYDFGYYELSPATDPRGAASGSDRVIRGGAYHDESDFCRLTFRLEEGPPGSPSSDLGFRVARSSVP